MPELPQKVVPFLQKVLRLLRNKPILQPAQVPDIDASSYTRIYHLTIIP